MRSTGVASREQLGVAVVAGGHWVATLIPNVRSVDGWRLVAGCDLDVERAHLVIGQGSGVEVIESVSALLDRDDIDAVATSTHFLGNSLCEFKVAEGVAKRILSMPLYPHLTVSRQERFVSAMAMVTSRL